jgi:hypothetical protein
VVFNQNWFIANVGHLLTNLSTFDACSRSANCLTVGSFDRSWMPMQPSHTQLQIRCGFVSETGRRSDNEDYAGIYLGTPAQRVRQGIVAAVADGVGGSKGGRVAAELAVRSFIDAYYSMPVLRPSSPSAGGFSSRGAAIRHWRMHPALLPC